MDHSTLSASVAFSINNQQRITRMQALQESAHARWMQRLCGLAWWMALQTMPQSTSLWRYFCTEGPTFWRPWRRPCSAPACRPW